MKQLIEDLISMMEYHVEQTRPIHTTTVALQAAREALKSLSAQPAPAMQRHNDYMAGFNEGYDRAEKNARNTATPAAPVQEPAIKQGWDVDTLLDKPAAPVQEPVAWRVRYHYGTDGMDKRIGDWKLVGYSPTPEKDKDIEPLYTTPPAAQRQWTGLTEQERNDIEDFCEMMIGKPAFEAIEAKLRSKNEY